MTPEIFSKLTRSAQEQYLIQNEILHGKYGQPGDVFTTSRNLAEARQVSVVTAHNILTGLCEAGYIELRGKKYYLSYSEELKSKLDAPNILGLIVPMLNNEYFSSLSDAVIESARERGYRVITITTSYSPSEEASAFQLLIQLGVAGIINCLCSPAENMHLYKESPVPCISLAPSLGRHENTSVQVNSFAIAQKVAHYLCEEGYRKFAYVTTKNNSIEKDSRFAGFKMGLSQNGYDLEAESIFPICSDAGADCGRLPDFISRAGEPVGIFCYHDLLAVQVYRVCSALGKCIPKDVGVVGFDDLSIASLLMPPLTTVKYGITNMAEMTLTLLLASIENPTSPCGNYYVEPKLIVRGSSSLSAHSDTSPQH
ncbi:MAG: substrate-binding domain-containing protein [Candidatus Limivicinus sp.]|jgi:DNA-binding LacI/PurR family transcriptional regulator